MTNKDKPKLIEILNAMNEVYTPNRTLSTILYEMYYQALKDLPIEKVVTNASKHFKTSQFFPKPADLRNDDNINDQALLAWEKTYKAIKKHGYWDSVKFDDPTIHSVIELMGGWREISDMLIDETKWKRKEFMDIYKVMQKRKDHLLIGDSDE